MLKIPKFSSNGLRHLSVCIHFEMKQHPKLKSFFEKRQSSLIVQLSKPPKKEKIVAYKIISYDNAAAHFHLEAGIEKAVGYSRFGTLTKDTKEVLTIDRELLGQKFEASIYGREMICIDDLESKSIISALLGVSATAADYDLILSGASADLVGPGPYRDMRWWDHDESAVIVEIGAVAEITVGDNALIEAAKIVDRGIKMFVRERIKRNASKK